MHIGPKQGVIRWLLRSLIVLTLVITALGCVNTSGSSTRDDVRPTPTVGPELLEREVIAVVKNKLSELTYHIGEHELTCLSSLIYERFVANYQGSGQWVVKTVGGTRVTGGVLNRNEEPFEWRWWYSERTDRVTWATEAHESSCDF